MPDAKDDNAEKTFLKGRVSSDNFENSADATAARQSSASEVKNALDQNLNRHSGSAGGHGLSIEICFADKDGNVEVLDSRELAEKAHSRARNNSPSQSISRAELELLSAKGEFAATKVLERFSEAKTDEELKAVQDGADRLFCRGKYSPGGAIEKPEPHEVASAAEPPPPPPLENTGAEMLQGSVQMDVELMKVGVGIVHGTANFALNSVAGIGNAIRIASAANFELSPISKICPDLYPDTEATKMYHDALRGIGVSARVMTQLATTFNPQSPLFRVEFDPEGAALTKSLALSLPKHIHDQFEKFGNADTEAKTAVATEAILNLATLLETGGAGAVAKGSEIAKLGEITKTGGELLEISSVTNDIALHSRIISSLSEKSQALKPLAEKFKECLNEFTKPVLVAEGVGEVRTGKGIIDDVVDIGKDVKDAVKPFVSRIDDYINYMKGKGKGSGDPNFSDKSKSGNLEKIESDAKKAAILADVKDAEFTKELFASGRAKISEFSNGNKRLQRTDLGDGREAYNWEAKNERFSPDVVRQTEDVSCVNAVGEMLSEGRLTEAYLKEKIGVPGDKNKLLRELGVDKWEYKICDVGKELEAIDDFCERGPWMMELYDTKGSTRSHHVIIVDGKNEAGNLMIRDPHEGTKYEMTIKELLTPPGLWNGLYIARKK